MVFDQKQSSYGRGSAGLRRLQCESRLGVLPAVWLPVPRLGCGSYYIVGVDPDWVPKSQPAGAETSFRPEIVSRPYCGAWNEYKVDDDGRSVNVSCKLCGLWSFPLCELRILATENSER